MHEANLFTPTQGVIISHEVQVLFRVYCSKPLVRI